MKNRFLRHNFAGLLAIVLMLLPIAGNAEYPDRPVTFVVSFGVGGSADRMTRLMASYIGEELGQPIQVINKPGAGTLLAANYVLTRPHDGYTILASSFAPYLINTILDGNADYSIDDFAYLNFQWFDEDIIAISKRSKYKDFPEVMDAIKNRPKTVRATAVRGSAGHLMAKVLLEANGIPTDNLNLVAYNDGGRPRAAVAGGVVDFIIIGAEGSRAISDYIDPVAIVSDEYNEYWKAPIISEAMASMGLNAPVIPGSIRGFAMSRETREAYPERFDIVAEAIRRALARDEVKQLMAEANMGSRWIGPQRSQEIMGTSFELFKKYSYLMKFQ